MTIQQVRAIYGLRETVASSGDDLFSICRRVYQSDDDIFLYCLQNVNELISWEVVQPGTVINYLPKSACNLVSEYRI